MVYFKVTWNAELKQHDWIEIIDSKMPVDPYIWQFITPRGGQLVIRNSPLDVKLSVMKHVVSSGVKPCYDALVAVYPHFKYLCIETTPNAFRYFHPLKDVGISFSRPLSQFDFEHCLPMLQIDIMNYILEWDRKNAIVSLLEKLVASM